MKKLLFPLLLSVLCCLPAQEDTTGSKPGFEFKPDNTEQSKLFPEVQKEARRIDKMVIAALVVPTRESVEDGFPLTEVRAFGRLVRTDAGGKLLPHDYDKLGGQLDFFETVLNTGEKYPARLPVLIVEPKPIAPMRAEIHYFSGNQTNFGELPRDEQSTFAITTTGGTVTATRSEALHALRDAIYPYQRNANAYTAYETRVQLFKMAGEWDDYFEKGRPQTFWDIAATTLFEYKHIRTDRLVGPPARQWFVLHPNLVIENLDAAPDGDQLGGALAIEWIGVNWWKGAGFLRLPIGISLSSVYSDRPGVDDVGHGVTLYFDNKYCIGWASHGGDNGFYVSIDMLKLIDSKKSKLEAFRSKIGGKLDSLAQ